MGRYGQTILTIVGTVVGAYFGYPALGAALGSLAGSLLFPTELPTVSGPRLADLTQTTSAVGTSIPRGWGTFAVAGSVIYQSDLREVIVSEEVGGKGGSEQTINTPTYYQDFAIALCEGEDPIANLGSIAGVRRIWANGKPIYDRRPKQADESDTDFNVRMSASAVLDAGMTIYLGTEDQEPDPTMEADKGIGNVSAFRGLAYIVFANWLNKQEDGNKMPLNWKFEVYTVGQLEENDGYEYANEFLPPWNVSADIPLYDTFDGRDVPYEISVEATGLSHATGRSTVSGTFSSVGAARSRVSEVAGRTAVAYQGYSITPTAGGTFARGITHLQDPQRTVGAYDPIAINLHWNVITAGAQAIGGNSWSQLAALGMGPDSPLHTNGYFLNSGGHSASTAGVYQWYAEGDYNQGLAIAKNDPNIDHAISTGRSPPEQPTAVFISGDEVITVRRLATAPGDQCAYYLTSHPGYCISSRGNLVRRTAWERIDASAYVLQELTIESVEIPGSTLSNDIKKVVKYPLSPALPVGHVSNTEEFWEAAYERAVARGEMDAGLVYGVDYPVFAGPYYRRSVQPQVTVETGLFPLDEVVRDLMRESGYVDADFDVTLLEDKTVSGYVRTRVMSGRAAIDPLRQAKFFDGIESNNIIKFVPRGAAIVASIDPDELGVSVTGEESPSRLTTTTIDETTLPRSVRVHYLAVSRDYEPGEQYSPARVGTRATNDVDVDIPMPLTDDEAAKIAEVLWSEAWMGRRTHQAIVDAGRQELEPSDPIEIPVDDVYRRVRILSIEDALPALRRFELIRDDDGSYISHAIGTIPDYVRPSLTLASPAEAIMLDIPALRDEDTGAGMYVAARPYLSDGDFKGAILQRSADGGASFTTVTSISTAAPIGYITESVPFAEHTVWDEANTIRVQMQYGELESRTAASVIGGANAAAIGNHGRWEIVQFRDAVHLGEGVWELSGLLRGRRGTEHNIGDTLSGDRFVMLSMGGIVRVPMSNADIDQPRTYRIIATGTTPLDATPFDVSGGGESLRPFSPVHLDATREDDDSIEISWIRRNRIGETLQSGTDIPMSEAVEEYEVDIVIDDTVVRTIETSTQYAFYTLAQQLEDFDSPEPVEIEVRIYQMSAVVGRGQVAIMDVILSDLPYEGDVTPEIDPIDLPDADAIIMPLVYEEEDEAVAPLTWNRLGDGPRITELGFLGDGYQARLRASSGLPAYVTAGSGGPLYLRATVSANDLMAGTSSRDVIVTVGVNDATANPKIEIAVVADPKSTGPNIAIRAYTSSVQTQRMGRPTWHFRFAWPEKVVLGANALPQTLCFYNGMLLLGAHYQEDFCRVHQVNRVTGSIIGYFDLGVTDTHVGGISVRQSDNTLWISDSHSEQIYNVDVEASLESHSMVILEQYSLSAISSVGSSQWVMTGEGDEYLLVPEYAVSVGAPRLYAIAGEDVTDGGAFVLGTEVKKLVLHTHCQGVAYKDGLLYMGLSTTDGGWIRVFDFDTWIAAVTNEEDWSVFSTGDEYRTPTEQVEDLDFDEAGLLWTCTEGEQSAGDEDEFLAVWSSPLTNQSVLNTYSAFYDGAGTLTIRINENLFTTKSWTITPTPGSISIGGPPQASAGLNTGFFSGYVRDVIIQSTDYNPLDYDRMITYENDGYATPYPLSLTNPGAEDGSATGWTAEIGSLSVRITDPSPAVGSFYFAGGANAHTLARQRIDLLTATGLDASVIDAGDCWTIVKWFGAGNTSNSDTSTVGVRFLDATQTAIGSDHLAGTFVHNPLNVWRFRSYGITVPANTRYIDVLMDMVRVTGTNNDGYVDEIEATLYVPDPNE